jgi:hypothetical protein
MNAKIASLPDSVREPLNQRLLDHEPADSILSWLNAIPEVKSILDARFGSQPLSPQDLSEWKANGFRNWQLRHDAAGFAASLKDPRLKPLLQSDLTDKLSSWLDLRFAAAARATDFDSDSADPALRRLHGFASDVLALRRDHLQSQRLQLGRRRLDLLQANAVPARAKEFLEWAKRPDTQEKLYGPPLTLDQQQARIREIFGLKSSAPPNQNHAPPA